MGAFNSVNSDTGNQSGQNSDRPGEETDIEFEDTHSEIMTTQTEARIAEGKILAEGESVINGASTYGANEGAIGTSDRRLPGSCVVINGATTREAKEGGRSDGRQSGKQRDIVADQPRSLNAGNRGVTTNPTTAGQEGRAGSEGNMSPSALPAQLFIEDEISTGAEARTPGRYLFRPQHDQGISPEQQTPTVQSPSQNVSQYYTPAREYCQSHYRDDLPSGSYYTAPHAPPPTPWPGYAVADSNGMIQTPFGPAYLMQHLINSPVNQTMDRNAIAGSGPTNAGQPKMFAESTPMQTIVAEVHRQQSEAESCPSQGCTTVLAGENRQTSVKQREETPMPSTQKESKSTTRRRSISPPAPSRRNKTSSRRNRLSSCSSDSSTASCDSLKHGSRHKSSPAKRRQSPSPTPARRRQLPSTNCETARQRSPSTDVQKQSKSTRDQTARSRASTPASPEKTRRSQKRTPSSTAKERSSAKRDVTGNKTPPTLTRHSQRKNSSGSEADEVEEKKGSKSSSSSSRRQRGSDLLAGEKDSTPPASRRHKSVTPARDDEESDEEDSKKSKSAPVGKVPAKSRRPDTPWDGTRSKRNSNRILPENKKNVAFADLSVDEQATDSDDEFYLPVSQNKHHLKPPVFNGTGNFETFHARFLNCVRYNNWSSAEHLAHLRNSLTDEAGQVLWDSGPEVTNSLSRLTRLLKDRYGGAAQSDRYRTTGWNSEAGFASLKKH